MPGRILEDFRHTAVRRMEQAGVPRSVAMKISEGLVAWDGVEPSTRGSSAQAKTAMKKEDDAK